MDTLFITRENLAALTADLLASGTHVAAPTRASDAQTEYRYVTDFAQVRLDGSMPRRSLKELFLPPTEPLLRWRQHQGDVELQEVPTSFPPTVVLGARPCDAAAVDVLDRVMGWDYRDELWFGRRAATTVISLACPGVDDLCFCSAVGGSPESTRGADLLLTPVTDGYHVTVVTDKGRSLLSAHPSRFGALPASGPLPAGPRIPAPGPLPLGQIRTWLESNFDHPLWHEVALRCHGCGACASVCPTCHCFDIVDEPEGVDRGTRRRNWDTCQTSVFTLHASGHNPRHDQGARFRQRLMHKFSIYPDKFGEVLCTGCGRCARACPAGQDIVELLGRIGALAAGNGHEKVEA
ncbi:MAG TPA: 4Fe-4S dicluster domain-containing protein [Thermoanaerobaculaceae bacterium]|nr:4Fe-4S dicluster domain-containing protein [Thermoanaerobaculaceae bacterium]